MRHPKITLAPAVLLTLANGFMDAHTYLELGGVFVNVQTANIILLAIDLVQQQWVLALGKLWPICAFMTAVAVAAHIKSGRLEKAVSYPLRWTMGIQVAFFVFVGFLPVRMVANVVIVAFAFLAGSQMSWFRNVDDVTYLPVASTGNLMRLVEAAHMGFVDGDRAARRAFAVYASVVGAFSVGACIGAAATNTWGHHCVFIPAGILAIALVRIWIDEHPGKIG
ncbi:YoaK family protein [Mycobacterium sp. ML4]